MLNDSENKGTAIVGRLLVTARALEQVGDAILERYGITLSMYELLMLISAGVNTTSVLARESRITPASITHKTKLMEEKGYISRRVAASDKRVWHFSLTPAGRRLMETVSATYDKVSRPLLADLSNRERQKILSFLTNTEEHMRYALENRSLMLEHIDGMLRQELPEVNGDSKRGQPF